MLRFVIYSILLILFIRGMNKLWQGIVEGASGRPPADPRGRVPTRGISMARDPVCGTFVVPERAVSLREGGAAVHFCSVECRDRYKDSRAGSSQPRAAGARSA